MIAKNSKGRNFRGILHYALEKDCEHIDSNMAGTSVQDLTQEFGTIRSLRPTLGKAVFHVALSSAIGERLNSEQWCAIGQKYLRGMGFTDNQFVMVRHMDTDHDHVHLIINRITHSGKVVSDSNDYQRQDTIMREIEREFGLQQVAPSSQAQRKAPTKGEIEHILRTNEPSTRQQLQQLASAAALGCTSYTDYQANLALVGVDVIPYMQLNDTKLNGLMYRLDGIIMKGSDLGKAYSPVGLAKKGVTYEKDRDIAAIRSASERESHRATQEQYQQLEGAGNPESGGTSGDAQTTRTRISQSGRGGFSIDSAGQQQHSEERAAHDRDANPSPADSDSNPASQKTPHPESMLNGNGNGLDDITGYQRILQLGRIQAPSPIHQSQSRRLSSSDSPRDPAADSYNAARQQIAAIGLNPFVTALHNSKAQKRNKGYSASINDTELQPHWAELQRQNALGAHVCIQATSHNLVIITALDSKSIDRLAQDQFPPLVVTESNGIYTAVIRLSDQMDINEHLRQNIGKQIAKTYGGQFNSKLTMDLVGFDHCTLVSTCNITAPKGIALVHEFESQVREQEKQRQEQRNDYERELQIDLRWLALEHTLTPDAVNGCEIAYLKEAQKHHQRSNDNAQASQIDSVIAKTLFQVGYSAADIHYVIDKCSPNHEGLSSPMYARQCVEQARQDRMKQAAIEGRLDRSRTERHVQASVKPQSDRGPSLGG